MSKLIEIENAIGIADLPTIRELLHDAQEQLLMLHLEHFESLSHSPGLLAANLLSWGSREIAQ